jgi:predicted RNA binding protein YcfA (HicA-like mRNA interferase family)
VFVRSSGNPKVTVGYRYDKRGVIGNFKHTSKSGSVCVAGNLGDEVPNGTLGGIVRRAGLEGKTR